MDDIEKLERLFKVYCNVKRIGINNDMLEVSCDLGKISEVRIYNLTFGSKSIEVEGYTKNGEYKLSRAKLDNPILVSIEKDIWFDITPLVTKIEPLNTGLRFTVRRYGSEAIQLQFD